MFRFTVLEDGTGRLSGFEAAGHAGTAVKGANLACAAASALVATLIGGLKDELGISLLVEQGADGFIRCRFAGEPGPERRVAAEMLMRVFARGLASLEEQK